MRPAKKRIAAWSGCFGRKFSRRMRSRRFATKCDESSANRSSKRWKSGEVRIRALEGEIKRLTDAVAELGLSKALKARLMSAEAEYGSLTGRVESRPPPLPSTEAIGAKIREVAMRLDTALGQDVTAARAILAGKLGPVVIEERDGAVWAQMQVGPALLFAAGAGFDSIQGCGGRI